MQGQTKKLSYDLKLYTKNNYKGQFNLLKAERRMYVICLKETQKTGKAINILGVSKRTFSRKMIAHSIKDKEWLGKKNKK